VIDDPGAMDVALMKPKSLSFHWEFMFTRSMFQTEDMIEQGNLLEDVSKLVDAGTLTTTATRNFGPVSEHNLNEALRYQASGTAIGKNVLG
jgi:hypothetical protein